VSPGKSQDEIFLEKLVGLVEKFRWINPDFKLENLSSDLNMSFSAQFIEKIPIALTGKKIVDFCIGTMRLKKKQLF